MWWSPYVAIPIESGTRTSGLGVICPRGRQPCSILALLGHAASGDPLLVLEAFEVVLNDAGQVTLPRLEIVGRTLAPLGR